MLLGGRLTQASRLGNASKIGPFFLKYAVPISQKTCRATTGYENEDYFADVIKVPGARFIECDMSDYQEIIELNQIINEF